LPERLPFRYFRLTLQRHQLAHSGPPLLQCAPYVLFIIAAFTLFPFWLITRTEAGGFIYYATLLFFFTKGYRADKKG